MKTFLQSYANPTSDLSLVVEDNGRVAYAYLVSNKKIVGDVWLYNSVAAPDVPEWKDKNKLPFLNPAEFSVQANDFMPVQSSDRVAVDWQTNEQGVPCAKIFIDKTLHASVAVGEKPGGCRFAKRRGPLANPL